MFTSYKLFKKGLTDLLKTWGWMNMTNEEFIAKIPADSLRFNQVVKELKKMNLGDTKVFKFDPRDSSFQHMYLHMEEQLASLAFLSKSTASCSWEVKPRKGIYLLTVSLY